MQHQKIREPGVTALDVGELRGWIANFMTAWRLAII
jgi:hypothetical protein